MKKGFTVASNPYDSLHKVVASFNDPLLNAAKRDEAEARLLEARANLLKAEADSKKAERFIENKKENFNLKRFEIEARMEIEKKNAEAHAQMAMAFMEMAKNLKST